MSLSNITRKKYSSATIVFNKTKLGKGISYEGVYISANEGIPVLFSSSTIGKTEVTEFTAIINGHSYKAIYNLRSYIYKRAIMVACASYIKEVQAEIAKETTQTNEVTKTK